MKIQKNLARLYLCLLVLIIMLFTPIDLLIDLLQFVAIVGLFVSVVVALILSF